MIANTHEVSIKHSNPNCSKPLLGDGLCLGNNLHYKGKIVKIEAISKEMVSVSGIELNRFTPINFYDLNLSHVSINLYRLHKLGFICNNPDSILDYYFLNDFTIIKEALSVFTETSVWQDYSLTEFQYYILIDDKWVKLNSISHIQNIGRDLYGFSLSLA